MIARHSDRVLEIYKMGLYTRNSTFETSVPTMDEWNTKDLGIQDSFILKMKRFKDGQHYLLFQPARSIVE